MELYFIVIGFERVLERPDRPEPHIIPTFGLGKSRDSRIDLRNAAALRYEVNGVSFILFNE